MLVLTILLSCGDISPNPGPRNSSNHADRQQDSHTINSKPVKRQYKPKYPCITCNKGVTSRSRAISCDLCYNWIHCRCTTTITDSQYDELVQNNLEFNYTCDKCALLSLPFTTTNMDDTTDTTDILPDHFNQQKPSCASKEHFECFNRKGLHFIHINARSLLPKLSELKIIADSSKAAVISITETWIDDTISNAELKIDGYNILRQDRSRSGGGVCAYIREDLAFNPRTDLFNEHVEAIWFEILLPKCKPIVVGTCYRPPKDKDFLEHFESIMSLIRTDCEQIILGDFNICFLHKQSGLFKRYLDVLTFFNCCQLIADPTRITDTSSTLLDHIVCNNTEKICQSGTINIGLSDHSIIYCTRKVVRGQINKHNIIKIRSMKNYNKDIFIQKLSNIDWSCILECDNATTAWNLFKQVFLEIIDTLAPVKEIKLKTRTEPWMDSEILESIRKRDSLLYSYKKDKSNSQLYKDFCKMRNKVQRDIKKAKAEYLSNQIEANKNNPKKLWQNLKSLGYSQKCSEQSNIVLEIDGQLCFDSNKVCNFINKFYTNVAQVLASKLPNPTSNYATDSDLFKKYYTEKGVVKNKFRLSTVKLCYRNKNP